MGISNNAQINTVPTKGQLKESNKIVIEFGNEKSKRILFVGNSITKHGPKGDIGWHGDWGMAASCKENDYVHIVLDRLKEIYGDISYCIAQCAEWESNYTSGNEILDKKYSAARDFNADIIIIRLGENINREDNKKISCKKYLDDLIKFFSINKNAKIIVTDNFWKAEAIDVAIKEIAEENGYIYCHIGDLEDDNENMAIGQFENRGVSVHPSDIGMKKIAQRILMNLEKADESE